MDKPIFDDAVQLAKGVIKTYADYFTGGWAAVAKEYATGDSRAQARKQLAEMLLMAGESKAWWETVNAVAVGYLRSDDPMPRELREWVADRLDGLQEKPAKSGPDPANNIGRNQVIVGTVQVLVDAGLRPTHNREKTCSPEGGSAGDAVLVALQNIGVHGRLTYGAIEKVWLQSTKYSRRRYADIILGGLKPYEKSPPNL